MSQKQRRSRGMRQVVLKGLAMVLIGIAVAASVRAGVVITQSTALHAQASRPVPLVLRFLEVQVCPEEEATL